MSSTKYLEISSRYRDRNEYPSPANFVVEISQSGQKNNISAKDPVSDASPVLYWNNSFQENAENNVTGTITVTSVDSDRNILQVTADSGSIRELNNFYNGSIFQVSVGGTATERRITNYEFLGNSSDIVSRSTVDYATTANLAGTYTGTPTFTLEETAGPSTLNIDGTAPTTGQLILVKNQSTATQNGIYEVTNNDGISKWLLTRVADYNESSEFITGEFFYVQNGSTNGETGWVMSVPDPFTLDTNNVSFTSVTSYATITVDRALPEGAITTGTITNPTPIPTNTANATIKFYIPRGSSIDNFYNGAVIQRIDNTGTLAETLTITDYDGTTRLATISSASSIDWSTSSNADNNYVIREERPVNNSTIEAVSTNGNIVQLNTSTVSLSSSNRYTSSYLRIVEGPPTTAGFSDDVAPYAEERRIIKYIGETGFFVNSFGAADTLFTISQNNNNTDLTNAFITVGGVTRQITSYDTTLRTGIISSGFGVAVTANVTPWNIRTAFLETAFTIDPVAGDLYELEQYSYDNWNPFAYNGSLTSSQDAVCYEIELINLILPNSDLISGGRAAFYPYLYVELDSLSSAINRSDTLIYSNNPNSSKMMFRAAIDDTPTPLISPFIKIDGDGMVQTVKFKPNDSFRFSIRLPNGTVFQTSDSDTSSPSAPNPLVQISALFSLKRKQQG